MLLLAGKQIAIREYRVILPLSTELLVKKKQEWTLRSSSGDMQLVIQRTWNKHATCSFHHAELSVWN